MALRRHESVSVPRLPVLCRRAQQTPPMRVYIIGNDGIALCREPPAAVNEGEIVVASNGYPTQPSSAANGCWRCGTLCSMSKGAWNSVTAAHLIDQLWSAIEALPDPEQQSEHEAPVKAGRGNRDAATTRGRNGRRSRERDGLAAAHGARSSFLATLKKKFHVHRSAERPFSSNDRSLAAPD